MSAGILDLLSNLPALADDAGTSATALVEPVERFAALTGDPATPAAIKRVVDLLTAFEQALPHLAEPAKNLAKELKAISMSNKA